MGEIKYHQNGTGDKYGANGELTNNWNPDCDYGEEYVEVHFRIDAPGYHSLCFSEEDKSAFYTEVKKVLEPLGWKTKDNESIWGCDYITKGKQNLYLHPQDFSGEILKKEIKATAEILETHHTFRLRWVDLYDTVYDITDSDYEKYLCEKDDEMRKALFNGCHTSRTTKFYDTFSVCRSLSENFRLKRIGLNDGRNYGSGKTIKHIQKVIAGMIAEGLLVEAEQKDCHFIRTPNKTEQKKLKLKGEKNAKYCK